MRVTDRLAKLWALQALAFAALVAVECGPEPEDARGYAQRARRRRVARARCRRVERALARAIRRTIQGPGGPRPFLPFGLALAALAG